MRIYTRAGDLAFKTFTFPDGQPHFKLETYEREFGTVTIEMALRNPTDLFTLLLVNDQLRRHGFSDVCLDIRYLLAARMDRAISWAEPFSLDIVARLINGAGFSRVRILDAHSEAATRLIRNSESVFPTKLLNQVMMTLGFPRLVFPDKGAKERLLKLPLAINNIPVIGGKVRDPHTGALTGFKIESMSEFCKDAHLLIVDDICDGGGTFVGLAKELRKAGAVKVSLFVTHNVQGKDRLEGIDKFFITDSYSPLKCGYTIDGHGKELVVIPVSMEKL